MAIVFNTEKRKLKDLKEYEFNPRLITKAQYIQLKKSIKKFGLAEIPCVNKDNIIIAGHQRIKILKELHPPEYEIDVRVPSRLLTEEEFQEYNIRSNKNTGEFDTDILANQFDIDNLIDYGFKHIELGINIDKLDEPSLDELIDDEKLKPPTIKITFKNEKDLIEAEKEIKKIIKKYNKSFYSVGFEK